MQITPHRIIDADGTLSNNHDGLGPSDHPAFGGLSTRGRAKTTDEIHPRVTGSLAQSVGRGPAKRQRGRPLGRSKYTRREVATRESSRLRQKRGHDDGLFIKPARQVQWTSCMRAVETSSDNDSVDLMVLHKREELLSETFSDARPDQLFASTTAYIREGMEEARAQSSSATTLKTEDEGEVRALADQVRNGEAITKKIKVTEAVYVTTRGSRKKDYDALASVDCLVVSDEAGCLLVPDQLDMHKAISKAWGAPMSTGATSDLLKRGVAIAQKLRHRRAVYSAIGREISLRPI